MGAIITSYGREKMKDEGRERKAESRRQKEEIGRIFSVDESKLLRIDGILRRWAYNGKRFWWFSAV